MVIEAQSEQDDDIPQFEGLSRADNPFARLVPLTADYATRPILEGFNWSDCLAGITAGEWYLVVFRSVRRETADPVLLAELDDRAHLEAAQSPGFLFYFKGGLNDCRECLSFCLWEKLYQAKIGARGPMHVTATHFVEEMYESYHLERYILTKYPGSRDVEAEALA